mmetsp:Transcript_81088/g.126439  ORF Transcript_81088/g.126439 Transcript_81088/m.126439 type:complete len:715 (+) Transcript_81088:96-2240(+)
MLRREPESYTSPSRAYASSPARQRSTDMFTVARANGNAGASEMNNAAATFSPRALSQKELSDAIFSGVVDGISRLGLLEKHTEVIECIRRLPSPAVDLSPITRTLAQLLTLKDNHSEVLEAITNVTVEQPDLSPILDAISRLPNHKEMNVVVDPPDLSPLQQMMEEMKVEIRESMATIRSDLQSDMSILQQEVLKNRDDTRSQAEVVLQELQTVPQEIVELRKEIRRLANQEFDFTEVLNEIRRINIPELDAGKVADVVVERLQRSRLRVDNSEVLQGLQSLEIDEAGFANLVTDRIRKLTLSMDSSEILDVLKRMPDTEVLAKAVIEKSKKLFPDRSDFNELSDIMKRMKRDPDMTPVLSALEIGQQQLLDIVGRIRIDNSPVLEALRKIESPDSETIGRVITDRLRKHNVATREEYVEMLGALRRIPDNAEVLESTRALGRALEDVQSLVDSLQRSLPDPTSLAGAVIDRLRRANLQVDSSEVLAALSGIRLAVTEVSHFDYNPILQEISKMNSVSDTRLASLQREIWQLRDGLAAIKVVMPPTQTMVSQMVQPPPTMQRVVPVPQMISSIAAPVTTSTPLTAGVQPQVLCAGTQELMNVSPRVVAELYGPKVSMPAVPLSESVQMKVLPAGYPQETYASTTSEVRTVTEAIATDGYLSPSRPESPRTPGQSSSPVSYAQDVSLKEELTSQRLGPPRGYRQRSARFPGSANM